MLLIQQPSMQWVDPVKNSAIFQGKMYFGLPRTDPKLLANRVQVYYFDTLGNPQPLPQPVNLSDSGVPTYLGNPVEIYANETCSIRVDDRNGLEKYLVDEYPLRSSEVVGVDSIKSLPSADFATGQYSVTGFYAGSTIGGGVFVWDASRNKADHNGGTIIAPEALTAWDGSFANLNVVLGWSGIGNGCFVRICNNILVEHFGVIPNVQVNNSTAINKAIKYSSDTGNVIYANNSLYYHSGIKIKSFCKLVGSGKYKTTFKLLSNSNTHSFSMDTPQEIKFSLVGFTVDGNKIHNTTSDGINVVSELNTSGPDATRPLLQDLHLISNGRYGLYFEGKSGFSGLTGPNCYNITSYYNGVDAYRFRRVTDGNFNRLVAAGSGEHGFYIDNCANSKFSACKSFYNASGGFLNTGGKRNNFKQCEAQEDYLRGVRFYAEVLSTVEFLLDANGRADSLGTGGSFQLCEMCDFDLKSTSFQIPTWQGTGIELNSNSNCKFIYRNSSEVPTPIKVTGTTNDKVYIVYPDRTLALYSGSAALIEVSTTDNISGAFIPELQFETNSANVEYTIQKGMYIKQGNFVNVHVHINCTLTKNLSAGNLLIRNLPFKKTLSSPESIGCVSCSNLGDNVYELVGLNAVIESNLDYAKIRANKKGLGYQTLSINNVKDGIINISFNLTYEIEKL